MKNNFTWRDNLKFLQTSKSIYESNLGNVLKGYNATFMVLKWIIVDWHLFYLLRKKGGRWEK